ncbi:MAG: hypothetical protein AAB114_05100, partial [Chloroflexota bacterium]
MSPVAGAGSSADGRVPRARWVVRGLLLFLLAFANLNDIWSPDVVPNTLFAWTLLREGDVDYDEFADGGSPDAIAGVPGHMPIPRGTYFFRACRLSSSGTLTVPAAVLYRQPRSPES